MNESAPTPVPEFNEDEVRQKKLMCGIFGILLGWTAIHKFLLGYTSTAVIQLIISVVTCGVGGLIGLIEGILYLTKSDEEFYQTYIEEQRPWF